MESPKVTNIIFHTLDHFSLSLFICILPCMFIVLLTSSGCQVDKQAFQSISCFTVAPQIWLLLSVVRVYTLAYLLSSIIKHIFISVCYRQGE